MPRIRRLDLRGFRGVRKDVALLFEGKSVLLFGENGTGKSSFVDALEKLFTGRVSTLDGRAQGLSSDRHGPHIRSVGIPPRIAVTFEDSASSTLTQDSTPASLPTEIQKYVESARENLYILRRRQVLQFIDCQPRERYDLLRPFLPLSGIEAMENALRTARERAEGETQRAGQDVARLLTDLRRELRGQDLGQEPTEVETVSAINQILKDVGQPGVDHLGDLVGAVGRLDAALAPFGDLTRQSRLSNAEKALEQLIESISSLTIVQLVTAVEALRKREAQEARVFYEAVLQQGIRWIQEEGRETCPLCEQPIEPSRVVAHARGELEAMQQVLDLRRQAQQALDRAKQTLRSAQEAAVRAGRAISSLPEEDQRLGNENLREVRSRIDEAHQAVSGDLRELIIQRLLDPYESIREGSRALRNLGLDLEGLRHILASLPSAEAAQRLLSVRQRIVQTQEIWAKLTTARTDAKEANLRLGAATRLYEDARTARKEEVQGIFDELSDDIDVIYNQLVDTEGHGGVRLEVREAVQGSANLWVNFYDQRRIDPRAYYSDARLDMLGLSVFLAIRRWDRKQRPNFDLLLLDDILTSVDNAHLVHVSEVLLSEFRDYQILLTTHDRIWFEHLRDIQARCRVASNFINKVIHKWTIEEGPDLREPVEERHSLEDLLQNGQMQDIAAMGGRLLEHVLQEMRYTLRLSVQAKRGEQYEIGELWPAFYREVRTNYPTLYQAGRQALDLLEVQWPLRNWIGAHFNIWARNVSRAVAVEFGRAVCDLFDLVYCEQCRQTVAPSATPLGQVACRRGHKIYPAPGKEPVPPRSRDELVRETDGGLRDARLDTALYFEWKRAETGREN